MVKSPRKPRNAFYLGADLIEETGIEHIDDLLYCLGNLLMISHGDRIRAIYCIGSYVYGGYTGTSDIDLAVLWKGAPSPEESKKASSVMEHVCIYSKKEFDRLWFDNEEPFYDSSNPGTENYDCTFVLRLNLKENSLLLFGEDIRDRIELGNRDRLLDDAIARIFLSMGRAHFGDRKAEIIYPLSDEGADFQNLEKAVCLVLTIARALVFLESGDFVWNKAMILGEFQRIIGGAFEELVQLAHGPDTVASRTTSNATRPSASS